MVGVLRRGVVEKLEDILARFGTKIAGAGPNVGHKGAFVTMAKSIPCW
jgi:hypothetical protein